MTQAVEQRVVLRTQVQELLEQLNHVEGALTDPRIDDRLRRRIGVRFQALVQQRRTHVLELRDELDGTAPPDGAWTLLHDARSECLPLFSECLAFVEGALVRAINLDLGLCATADALLEELAALSERPWERFTILADGESFIDLAEIIRIRFPDVHVWSLPVAAHEFGHYVGRTFADDQDVTLAAPFERATARGERELAYLHEHFADFFATYAMGPAYACTCVLQRFDPRSALNAAEKHPASLARVRLSLDVLGRMDQDAGLLSPFSRVRAVLASTWEQMVATATGGSAELAVEAEAALADLGDQLWGMLEYATPGVRYRGWLPSQQIAETLLTQHRNGAALSAQANDLRDMLNAAWSARLTGPPAITQPLAEWSAAECRRLVPDGLPPGGDDS